MTVLGEQDLDAAIDRPDIAADKLLGILEGFREQNKTFHPDWTPVVNFGVELVALLREGPHFNPRDVRAFAKSVCCMREHSFAVAGARRVLDKLLDIARHRLLEGAHDSAISGFPTMALAQVAASGQMDTGSNLKHDGYPGAAEPGDRQSFDQVTCAEVPSLGHSLPNLPPLRNRPKLLELEKRVPSRVPSRDLRIELKPSLARAAAGTAPKGRPERLPYILTQFDIENSDYDERDLQVYLSVNSRALKLVHGHTLKNIALRSGQNPQDAARISLQAAKVFYERVSYQHEAFLTCVALYAQFTGRRFQRELPRKDSSAADYFLEALRALETHPLSLKKDLDVQRELSIPNLLTSLISLHDPTFTADRHQAYTRPLYHVFIDAAAGLHRVHGESQGQQKFYALVRDVVIGLLRVRQINPNRFAFVVQAPLEVQSAMVRWIQEYAKLWFPEYRPAQNQDLATLCAEMQLQLDRSDAVLQQKLEGFLSATAANIGQQAGQLMSELQSIATSHLLDLDRRYLHSLSDFLAACAEYHSAELFSSRRGSQEQARGIFEKLRSEIRNQPTRLSVSWILRVLEHGWRLIDADFTVRKHAAAPRLRVQLLKDQLPLSLGGNTTRLIEVQLQVSNEADDSANEVQVTWTIDPSAVGASLQGNDLQLRTLEGHRTKVFTASIELAANLSSLVLNVDLAYRYDGKPQIVPTCHLEITHSTPKDLTPLVDGTSPPYSLDAIHDPVRLRGRRELMDQLQTWLKTQTRVPVILFGQRRVGKSSVGAVFARNAAKQKSGYVVTYFEWLVYVNSPLWSIVKSILETHVMPGVRERTGKAPPALPPTEVFREDPLGCFSNYLLAVMKQKQGTRFLFVIDEFDSIAISYEQKLITRGFFAWLRGLMNIEGVRFVFIGGEGLPNVLNDFGEDFNRSVSYRIDHLDYSAAIELVQDPVQGYLQFSPQSLLRIYEYADGNPYYSTWLAVQLLNVMKGKQEGIVSIVDVEQAVNGLLYSFDQSKFVHLWQKHEDHYSVLRAVADAAHTQAQGRSLFFMEYAPVSLIRQSSSVRDMDEAELLSALDVLETRRVLLRRRHPTGWSYRIRIGLFADWLIKSASLELRGISDLNLAIWEGASTSAKPPVLLGEGS